MTKKCQNFYFENESQGQGVGECDLRHSIANVDLYDGNSYVCSISHRLRDIHKLRKMQKKR